MSNFFDPLVKYKKIVILFVFCCTLILGMFFGSSDVKAQTADPGRNATIQGLNLTDAQKLELEQTTTYGEVDAFIQKIQNASASQCGVSLTSSGPVLACLVEGISSIGNGIYNMGYYIDDYSGNIFDFVNKYLIEGQWAITKLDPNCPAINKGIGNPVNCNMTLAFVAAYNAAKNWANEILVLGFIAIAIAWMLSLDQYKKLLVPLLITTLLINFAIVFVGLMIDVSNIAISSFLGSNTDSGNTLIFNNINGIWSFILSQDSQNHTSLLLAVEHIGIALIFALIHTFVGITFLLLSIIFTLRYAWLVILFILSPLAFALRVFPLDAARKAWSSWWEKFLQWCFAGLITAFFLRLAIDVLYVLPTYNENPVIQNLGQATTTTNSLIFSLLIALTFILVGLRIAYKQSGALGKLAMNLTGGALSMIATGGAGVLALAGNAAAGTAKGAGKAAGSTKLGESIKEKTTTALNNVKYGFTRIGERSGVVKQGTANLAYQNKQEARMKPYEELAKAEKNPDIIADRAMNSNNPAERAVNTKRLQEMKRLDKIPDVKRQEVIANANAYNVDTKEFIKSDPRLAITDKLTVEDQKKKLIGTKNIAGHTYTEEDLKNNSSYFSQINKDAETATIASAYRRQNVSDIREMSKDAFTEEFLENTTAKRVREAGKDLSFDKKAILRGYLGKGGKLNTLGNKYIAYAFAARAAGDTTKADEYQAKVEELRKIYAEIKNNI